VQVQEGKAMDSGYVHSEYNHHVYVHSNKGLKDGGGNGADMFS